jgi:phosphatidylinositol 4-kinase
VVWRLQGKLCGCPVHNRTDTNRSYLPSPPQLPCFSHGKPVDSLRARFRLDLSDAAAAAYMQGLVLRSYDKWTTGGYDYIQYLQNAIPK